MTLRASSLTRRWPRVLLRDAVEFLDHLRKPITASERTPGPYPYYGANGQQDSVSGYIFDEPLVLLAEDGGHFDDPARGVAYKVSGRCWVNNHAHVLRPHASFDVRYLGWHLAHYDISEFVNGTTRAKLTKGAAEMIPIAMPPRAEQQRIADMLDKADSIRRKRKQAIALTDDLLRSIFLDMFGDPDTNPKGWPVAVVDDLCSHIVDCPHSTPKYGGKGRLHPCVRTSDLQDGFFDWSTTKHVDAIEYNERITRLAPIPGDVFYTREGERYGIAAILPDNVFACLGQRMMLLRANPAVATAEFLWALMNSSAIYQRAQAEAGGSTSPHVNVGSVRRFRGMRPPLELQRHYSRIYATTALARVRNQAAIRECERLFFSLSAQAFAGASAMQC